MFITRKTVAMQLYFVIGLSAVAMLILLGTSLTGSSQMADAGRALFETGLSELKRAALIENRFERMRGLVARAPAELDLARQTEFKESFKKRHFLQSNCAICAHRNPVIYDEMVANAVEEQKGAEVYKDIEKTENMSPEEKWGFFMRMISRCIRCYACRNACHLC